MARTSACRSRSTPQVQVAGEFDCSRTHGTHPLACAPGGDLYYSDNEILKLLVTARSAIGLQTRMKTTKLCDSAGNALVENAIQRIRAVAATLMEAIVEETGLRFNNQHPLWTWCCQHAAWTLNRFQVVQGTTSYELVFGHTYEGKLCRFGEIVFAYTKHKQGYKADPRWKIGVCLGKSEVQDAWVIGDGSRVFLSRSICRVQNSWSQYLACFKGFSPFSLEFQTNFGGRIVPSKRFASSVEGPMMKLPFEEVVQVAEDDHDALLAFSRSYAGKLEERKGMENVEVEDAPKTSEKQEEQKIAEDKRKGIHEGSDVEELKELAPIRDPRLLDETKNQAGPSVPLMPTTPCAPPLKALQSIDSPEPEAKKFKPVHELQGSTASEAKRMKPNEEAHQERRAMETQVGDDVFAHQDEVLSKEEIEAWLMEAEEWKNESQYQLPEELWSSADLD